MKRIDLTLAMPIKTRLEIIVSRIEKAKQDILNNEVKTTMDVLRNAAIEAKFKSLCERLNKRL
jgi:hypothetical protein